MVVILHHHLYFHTHLCFSDRPVIHLLQVIGGRLAPDQLLAHRQTHTFKAPCCLCASVDPNLGYTETAIMVSDRGEFVAEYVAKCALQACGYLSK